MSIERVLYMSFDLGVDFKAKYELKNEIGRSTNSRVYRIVRLDDGNNDLVVKILCPKIKNTSNKLSQRLKREIETMIKLRNSNIDVVEILDFNIESGHSWYIMRRGVTLSETLEKKKFQDNNERIILVLQIIKIVCQVHSQGYAHRDLKLENILIFNEKIELADFGIVWHPDFTENLTEDRERVGNWKTIAPELKRSNIIVNDYKPSDVFSVTKVAWMILALDFDCFDGQYNLDTEHSLRISDLKLNAEKILHRLFHRGTDENFLRRISVMQFYEEFQNWAKINWDKNASNRANFDDSVFDVLQKNRPSETRFSEFREIFDSLMVICNRCQVRVSFKKNMQGTFSLNKVELDEIIDCIQMRFFGELEQQIFVCKPVQLLIKKFQNNRYYVELWIDEVSTDEVSLNMQYLGETLNNDELYQVEKIKLREEILEISW